MLSPLASLSRGLSLLGLICHENSLSFAVGWCVIRVVSSWAGVSWGCCFLGWSVSLVCSSWGWSPWAGVSCRCCFLGLVCPESTLSVVCLSWGWSLVQQVCLEGFLSLSWSVVRVFSYWAGLSWGYSLPELVCHEDFLLLSWAVVRAFSPRAGLSWGFSLPELVLSWGFSLPELICREGFSTWAGLSWRFSLPQLVCHKGFLSLSWCVMRVLLPCAGLWWVWYLRQWTKSKVNSYRMLFGNLIVFERNYFVLGGWVWRGILLPSSQLFDLFFTRFE